MLHILPIKKVKSAATELSGPMYTRHVHAGVQKRMLIIIEQAHWLFSLLYKDLFIESSPYFSNKMNSNKMIRNENSVTIVKAQQIFNDKLSKSSSKSSIMAIPFNGFLNICSSIPRNSG